MADFYPRSLSCQISVLSEIYSKQFGNKKDGFFVDVGAHDGYYCSNVWGLAQVGWRGLLFEPMPVLAARARVLYGQCCDVSIVEAAVGDHDGRVKLYTSGNPTINLEAMHAGSWGHTYDQSQYIEVDLVCLNTALAENKVPPFFDVLSIDVEGAELEVLDGIDFSIWYPKMVILEVCKDHPIASFHIHTDLLEARMRWEGFLEVYHDAINSIYIRP